MSVRFRLALWNVAVIAFAIIGMGALVHELVRQNLMDGLKNELRGRAKPLVLMARYPPPFPINDTQLTKQFKGLRRPPMNLAGEMQPRIFDDRDFSLFPGDKRPPIDPSGLQLARESGAETFTVMRRREEPPLMVYSVSAFRIATGARSVVQVSESLERVGREMALLTGALLTQIPIALAIATLGALFLTDRALRPIRAVTEAAAEIEATDFSRRLPVTGKDEFARLAETLNGMLGRLESAFERQRRFVADASHELKSPLTIIKANSSLSLTDPTLPENARIALQEIDAAADRTHRVVQDLLLLARSDAGDLTPRRELFSIRPICEDVTRQMRRLYPGGAMIEIDAPENLALYADPEQIRRLLANLLANAVRHTPAEGNITLSAQMPGDAVLLSVRDTGDGIAPEHLARLGERFYRPDAARARATGGTGLGLSICRAIAEAHGGTLHISSEPGCGTEAVVRYPSPLPPPLRREGE